MILGVWLTDLCSTGRDPAAGELSVGCSASSGRDAQDLIPGGVRCGAEVPKCVFLLLPCWRGCGRQSGCVHTWLGYLIPYCIISTTYYSLAALLAGEGEGGGSMSDRAGRTARGTASHKYQLSWSTHYHVPLVNARCSSLLPQNNGGSVCLLVRGRRVGIPDNVAVVIVKPYRT